MTCRNAAIVSLSLLAIACSPATPRQINHNAKGVADSGNKLCESERAQYLIGRLASAPLAEEVRRTTGGVIVRWIQPGQFVTMEYRPDRINITLDAENKVIRITCG